MSEIIVRNQKILDFYKRNPSLNFEQINLIIIDLLDQLQNGEHNSLVNSQILTHVDELKSNVQELLKSNATKYQISDILTKAAIWLSVSSKGHKMRIWEPLVTLNSIDRRRDDRRTETG